MTANNLRFNRAKDGAPGYTVHLGKAVLGVVWYARDCRCWYASPDPTETKPSYSACLGSKDSKKAAAEGLCSYWALKDTDEQS